MDKTIRIGGASGFWGDSCVGAPQLVAHGQLDYLVFDYLAELTLALLATARSRDPTLGYATDFVQVTMKAILADVVGGGIRVISNAGGVNPQACAQALRALATEQGVTLKIAVVTGDDVTAALPQMRAQGVGDLDGGAPLPDRLLSANAYLGALPIRAALDAGAQVVITGRCVDSAVTLGALLHAFDWREDDWDRLAQGSLAGHLIECGCQATGGLHTDWQDVPDWAHIGYPVLECQSDGGFVVTKPRGTGGLVNTAVVAEQLLYEIGDPRRYLLPDVTCDFTQVRLVQLGEHRVQVSGARGIPPGPAYKVSATWFDGHRCTGQLTVVGLDAARKAQRTGEGILARTRELLARRRWLPYTRTHIEVLGSEIANYGPHARGQEVREVVLQVSVTHPQKEALELFAREIAPAGTSWSPGTTGASGRPAVAPVVRGISFLIDKGHVQPQVHLGTEVRAVAVRTGQAAVPPQQSIAAVDAVPPQPDWIEVPLVRLAWARSGDKGDQSNIGVIARSPEWLPWLRAQLTPAAVKSWLGHLVLGDVTRYDLPGIHALNFVCMQALDGGGLASLRNDALGKGMAQVLLAMPVRVPSGFS
ncbi:acyclic terpene utilization AtuA family protein [Ramlibacter sp.]|uniref:acyclic terpene utilization AtuA family protein n=1 Tax=Ramlibacter sp. TaxID=1917967 RepID=UPI00260D1EB9|nr:acyclic terpene utilization AtuA family protein [Ramlibacter sp.]MDB5958545.1 h16 [Ramlibacter sp.]